MKQCMLTTINNPYDPFTQFDSWYLCDLELSNANDVHVPCCSYLARIAKTSDQLTDEENAMEVERAIDEIIQLDFMNIYKKVSIEESKASQFKLSVTLV